MFQLCCIKDSVWYNCNIILYKVGISHTPYIAGIAQYKIRDSNMAFLFPLSVLQYPSIYTNNCTVVIMKSALFYLLGCYLWLL